MATRWQAPEEPVARSKQGGESGGFAAGPRGRTTRARLLLLLGRL
jgi:hypothetical protein